MSELIRRNLGTLTANGTSYPIEAPPGQHTFTATVNGTGSVAATVAVQGTNDINGAWVTVATLSASGTTVATGGGTATMDYTYWRYTLSGLTGTSVSVLASSEVSSGAGMDATELPGRLAALGVYGSSPTACIIGNSLAYKERRTISGAYYQSSGEGLFDQINSRSGQYFKLLNMAAADGIGLANIVDNFDSGVTPYRPNYVFCLGTGENNVVGGTDSASYTTLLAALLAKCRAIGAKLIITMITPGGSIITTGAMRDSWLRLNRLQLDFFKGQKDVCLLRTDRVLADPTATYPSPIPGGYTDGAWHWCQRGAALLADRFIAQIEAFTGGFTTPFDGTYSAGSTDVSALCTNTFNTGSGAAGSGLTGTVPGSGIAFSLGGTGAGAASLVSRLIPDGVPGNWVSIDYTGPVSPVWNTDRIRANTAGVTLSAAGLAVGDWVQGLYEVAADNVTNGLMGFQTFLIFTNSSGTFQRAYGNVQNNGAGTLTPLLSTALAPRTLGTAPIQIPAGTTAITLYCEAHPSGASAVYTAKFGRHAVRKIDSTWY